MKNMEQRFLWATTFCRKAQMRLTPVREAILSFLARRQIPATLEMVSQADGVWERCDVTTVYRTLMMFKEADLVRLVGSPRKASYFVLNIPDESSHFLVCRRCGSITALPLPDTITAEIERIVSARGFSPTPQDCEVFGLCATCQDASKTQAIPSKLIVRATGEVARSKKVIFLINTSSRDKP
jgi:Fe2+ or Zn2+ uptake regulation protein